MQEKLRVIRAKVLVISLNVWLYVFMLLSLLIVSLVLGSLLSKSWVESDNWTGGILRISSGRNAGEHYSEQDCSSCLYSKLYRGGVVVIVFDLLSLILTLTWLSFLVFSIRGIEIFPHWINTPILVSAFIAHWIGIITWGAVTQVTFTSDTHYSSTGPGLSISVAVLQPLINLFYLFVFTKEKEHIPELNSVRLEKRIKWSEPQTPDNKN